MQRGAIFDLDGTLADTAGDLLAAANVALAPYDLAPLDPVADRAIAGRGGRAMIRRALEVAGRDPNAPDEGAFIDRVYPELLGAYERALAVETRLFDGVEECLDALQDSGWRLGVCTNKPEYLALQLLDALGVRGRFGAILGADTLPVRKPDPEHFVQTAVRIGASARHSVMIGDTVTDLSTARAAGVPCVLTSFGFAAEPLDVLAPDGVVHHYTDIPPELERLSPLAQRA